MSAISLMRAWLMREPSFSSIHMRPPPAPQQRPFSRERSQLLQLEARDRAEDLARGAS